MEEVITDQNRGVEKPPLQKKVEVHAEEVLELPGFNEKILLNDRIIKCFEERESRRKYSDSALSLEELSYLLRITQGVKEVVGDGYATKRTVPSAGARHPFETYLAVNNVKELKPGIYIYLPINHKIAFLFEVDNLRDKLTEGALGQKFVGNAACVFIWSCIPYRTEWRYHINAHKAILLDAGHVCQNLYLGVESINCGTCAIGAYDQSLMDNLLTLDGSDEFVVYLAPVGRKES